MDRLKIAGELVKLAKSIMALVDPDGVALKWAYDNIPKRMDERHKKRVQDALKAARNTKDVFRQLKYLGQELFVEFRASDDRKEMKALNTAMKELKRFMRDLDRRWREAEEEMEEQEKAEAEAALVRHFRLPRLPSFENSQTDDALRGFARATTKEQAEDILYQAEKTIKKLWRDTQRELKRAMWDADKAYDEEDDVKEERGEDSREYERAKIERDKAVARARMLERSEKTLRLDLQSLSRVKV
jgi:hypothetical protein